MKLQSLLQILIVLILTSVQSLNIFAPFGWLRKKLNIHHNNLIHNTTDLSIDTEILLNDKRLPRGLKNLSNTCYINSILQLFYNCKQLKEFVLSNHFEGNSAGEELKRIFKNLSLDDYDDDSGVDTNRLTNTLGAFCFIMSFVYDL